MSTSTGIQNSLGEGTSQALYSFSNDVQELSANSKKRTSPGDSGGPDHCEKIAVKNEEGDDHEDDQAKKKTRRRSCDIKKKPKDMPRRPLSAYNFFFQEERKRVLEEREKAVQDNAINDPNDDKKPDPELFAKLGKTIAARWRRLTTEGRQRFNDKATKDMKRYRLEMDIYQFRKERGLVIVDDEGKFVADLRGARIQTTNSANAAVSDGLGAFMQQQTFGAVPSVANVATAATDNSMFQQPDSLLAPMRFNAAAVSFLGAEGANAFGQLPEMNNEVTHFSSLFGNQQFGNQQFGNQQSTSSMRDSATFQSRYTRQFDQIDFPPSFAADSMNTNFQRHLSPNLMQGSSTFPVHEQSFHNSNGDYYDREFTSCSSDLNSGLFQNVCSSGNNFGAMSSMINQQQHHQQQQQRQHDLRQLLLFQHERDNLKQEQQQMQQQQLSFQQGQFMNNTKKIQSNFMNSRALPTDATGMSFSGQTTWMN